VSIAAGLAALADEELSVVLDGRVDELEGLAARRDLLLQALGEQPVHDPSDRALLEHALRVQALAGEALREQVAITAAELARLGERRTAAQGYHRSTNV
jgi:hypothetical protein